MSLATQQYFLPSARVKLPFFPLPMPPKASTKSEKKEKAKIIEDKTFGLKNKNKSSKVSRYVAQVESQVKNAGSKNAKREEELARARKEQKKLEEAAKAELAQIYKPVVQQQKVAFGVDPKTVLCAYFKAGQCSKGDKCKFSHDMNVERKSTKINLYADARDQANVAEDPMDTWDQSKLEQVVEKKHGPGIKTTTDIVCKYFLEAIENKKYGWFWECPNGGDSCKYRHALPPGFVLKSQMAAKARDEDDSISLEEFLETERYRIKKETPVTAESFAKWKRDRKERQEADEKARASKREADYRAGRLAGMVSGRDLFVYNPDLFKDDDEAMEVDYTAREASDHEGDEKGQDDHVQVNDVSLFENLEITDDEDEE